MAAFTDISQMKTGMRVRCVVLGHHRTGKTAVVKNAKLGWNGAIDVVWDDGDIREPYWSLVSSFEPVDEHGGLGDVRDLRPVGVPVRQEKPCQVCGKPNDVGVKVCWMCGMQP